MLILAYFFVFIVGLFTCFNHAKTAWINRKLVSNTAHQNHSYFLKAFCSIAIGCLAIGGLIQSSMGVF